MVYLTSDLHLGPVNIIKLCDRPFGSVEEMDETLIGNWNSRVTNGDHVYIAGDFVYGNETPAESVDALLEIDACGKHITLCHYPLMSWPHMGRKSSLHVYGHLHNNRDVACWPLLRTMDRALNAGVEINDYSPVTIDELVANNERFRAEHDGTRETIRTTAECMAGETSVEPARLNGYQKGGRSRNRLNPF